MEVAAAAREGSGVGLAELIAAPIRGPLRAAGAKFASASWGRFAIATFFWIALITLAYGALRIWNDTLVLKSGTTPMMVGARRMFIRQPESRTLSAVWHDWRFQGLRGPAAVLLHVPVFYLGLFALAAFILGPDVHSQGTVGRSLGRAARASVGASGWLLLVGGGVGAAIVWVGHSYILGQSWFPIPDFLRPFSLFGAILLVLTIIGRCVLGARDDPGPYEGSPCCEGCGYQLTHVPASGLCPECRTEADYSLQPGRWRSGVAWERGETATKGDLVRSLMAIVATPGRFYSSLCVRGDDVRARRFAIRQFWLICLGALVWMLAMVMVFQDGPRPLECLTLALLPAITGWCVWRLIAAISTWWWFIANELPDPRWSRKVVQYESAYLWIFCLFCGSGVTVILAIDRWAPNVELWLKQCWVMGLPFPPFILLIGVATLGLFGLYRYRIALRAIRHSNY